jgi:hypothetical protein
VVELPLSERTRHAHHWADDTDAHHVDALAEL